MNPALNGECGPWLDQTFGRARPSTNFEPGTLDGWGVRPGDWQMGVSVQHEVLPRTSVEVGYARRWWQNFADVTDNLALSTADYDPFSVVGADRSAAAERRRLHDRRALRPEPDEARARPTTSCARPTTTAATRATTTAWT